MSDKKCISCNKKKFISAFPFNTEFNNKTFYYKKCTGCKFVRIFPYPNKKDLDNLYDNKSYHIKFYSNIKNNEYIDSVKYLNKFINKNNKVKLLDFGSGHGHFIKEIYKIHKCYGVEYSVETLKQLRKKFKKQFF